MKVGIIGFARSGKTTVFNSLTGAHAEVGAFGSREANLAVLKVPDERVDRLAEIYKPKKITYAEFQFVDVAPDEAAGEEKALSSASLTALRHVEALVHVVRAYTNENVMHPLGGVDPARGPCLGHQPQVMWRACQIGIQMPEAAERERALG